MSKTWKEEEDREKADQRVSDKKVNKVCEKPPALHNDGGFAPPLRLSVAQPQCLPATLPQFLLQQYPSTVVEGPKPLVTELKLQAGSRMSGRRPTPET